MLMRPYFASLLHQAMQDNDQIWVVTGDLGYGLWNQIREDFPERFVNVGAAEQAMMGTAVGLALEEKIPIVYSITPFLLYRPFETIRNYLDHEQIPVKMVGSGRNYDYHNEGFSHWASEDKQIMSVLKNIKSFWPEANKDLDHLVPQMLNDKNPWYVNLKK